MNRQQSILTDTLQPQTIGEMIDALIIMNFRMWHEQEHFFRSRKAHSNALQSYRPSSNVYDTTQSPSEPSNGWR
jgi:hypothetical protein